jgi:hypothetical protein
LSIAIPDWAEQACADETFAADNPEICEEGYVADTCSDSTLAALEETSDETKTNLDCSVECICDFYEDLDTDALDSCTETCEETEPDPEDDEDEENGDPDCIAHFDDLLDSGEITEDEYYEWLATDEVDGGCGVDLFDGWHLEIQGQSSLVSSASADDSSIFDESGIDLEPANDASGTLDSSEVASSASEFIDSDGNWTDILISGLELNAYDYNSPGWAGKINVECVWLAWRTIENGEIQDAQSASYEYTGDGTAKEGCDDEDFETKLDYSETNSAIVGVGFSGNDCGIEAGVYRNSLLAGYDPTEGRFLGDSKDYYYKVNDTSDSADSEWCKKADTLWDDVQNVFVDNDGNTECKNTTPNPDISILHLIDQDAFIVGIGIQATKDGNRCAINIFAQTLEVTMSEGDYYGWYEEDEPEPEPEPEAF